MGKEEEEEGEGVERGEGGGGGKLSVTKWKVKCHYDQRNLTIQDIIFLNTSLPLFPFISSPLFFDRINLYLLFSTLLCSN